MDDGYGAACKEADRADLAEQKLEIAENALSRIAANYPGTALLVNETRELIKTHVLKYKRPA